MRRAESSQHWTKLRVAAPYPSRLESVKFTGIAGLLDGDVQIRSPISIICGLNGVGKTLLLRLLWSVLDVDGSKKLADFSKRIAAGTVKVALFANNNPIERVLDCGTLVSTDEIPENIQVSYIDAPHEAIELAAFFSGISSVDDILNGIDPIPLDQRDLDLLRYITGKPYSKVEIFEIEQFEPAMPFFRATEYGVTYDIKTMSLGEVSCFYILWHLRRARNGGFFFIDEPETFISPNSQSAMMDFFACMAEQKRLNIVISSHSPRMMNRLGEEGLIPMFGSPDGSRMYDRTKWRQFLQDMGFSSGRKNVILVEDRLARTFCSLLLQRYDLTLLTESEILYVGGESVITRLRQDIPKRTKNVRFVGVYDGDITSPPELDDAWPYCVLPGGNAIEELFRELVFSHPDVVGEHLARPGNDVRHANAMCAGLDMHDWLLEFGKSLGFEFEPLVSLLTKTWIQQGNEGAAKAFVAKLRHEIDPSNIQTPTGGRDAV